MSQGAYQLHYNPTREEEYEDDHTASCGVGSLVKARSNAELQSLLQTFKTKPSEDFKDYLLVYCPKEDCPSNMGKEQVPFLVHKRTWYRPLRSKIKPEIRYFSRPCTYCFRASKLK